MVQINFMVITPDNRMGNMAGDGDRYDVACDPLSIPNDVITPLLEPLICLPSRAPTLRTSQDLRRRDRIEFPPSLTISVPVMVGTKVMTRPMPAEKNFE